MPEMTWFNITVIFIASVATACTFMLMWQLANFKSWALQRDLQKDAQLEHLEAQLAAVHPEAGNPEAVTALHGEIAVLQEQVDNLIQKAGDTWHIGDESQRTLEIGVLQKSVEKLQESHSRIEAAAAQVFLLEAQVEAIQRRANAGGDIKELSDLVERQETDLRAMRMRTRELTRSLRDLYKWVDEIDESLDGEDQGAWDQLPSVEEFKVRRLR